MYGPPLNVGECCPAIDDVTEHVEHAGEDRLAHGSLQRSARIKDHGSAGEPVGGRQCDAAHVTRVGLGKNLHDDLLFVSRVKKGVNRRQTVIESGVNDASPYSHDDAAILRLSAVHGAHRACASHFQLRISGKSCPCLQM